MPKTKTTTKTENPTTEAYAEACKEVQSKADHHRRTADAYRSLLNSGDCPDVSNVKQRIHKHETMAGVQIEIAEAIKQMNRDFLCDHDRNGMQ